MNVLTDCVFVVADDQPLGAVLTDLLREMGYVALASSPAAAQERGRALQPALIVLAVVGSDALAQSVHQRLRADPWTAAIPVVAVVPPPRGGLRPAGAGTGASLGMPFALDDFVRCIAQACAARTRPAPTRRGDWRDADEREQAWPLHHGRGQRERTGVGGGDGPGAAGRDVPGGDPRPGHRHPDRGRAGTHHLRQRLRHRPGGRAVRERRHPPGDANRLIHTQHALCGDAADAEARGHTPHGFGAPNARNGVGSSVGSAHLMCNLTPDASTATLIETHRLSTSPICPILPHKIGGGACILVVSRNSDGGLGCTPSSSLTQSGMAAPV